MINHVNSFIYCLVDSFFCNICKLILTQRLELYLCIYETLYLCYVRMSPHSSYMDRILHSLLCNSAEWLGKSFYRFISADFVNILERLNIYKTKNKVKWFSHTNLCKGSWLTSAGHMTYPPHHFAISAPALTQHIVNSHVFLLKLKGSQFL